MVIHRIYIAMCRVPADTKLSKLDTLRLAMTYINHLHGMVIEADSDTGAVTPETRERENRENRENREGRERLAHKRSWPYTHPSQAPLSSSRAKYEDNNNGLALGQMGVDTGAGSFCLFKTNKSEVRSHIFKNKHYYLKQFLQEHEDHYDESQSKETDQQHYAQHWTERS